MYLGTNDATWWLQEIELKLNTSLLRPSNKIHIFLYSKGNGIVPTHVGIYGSADIRFYTKENFSLEAYIDINRSEIKALDKPSERCEISNQDPSVSKCVGHFIENNLNCSLRILMSNSMRETCNLEKIGLQDLKHLEERVRRVTNQEEREIFEMTGCMPGCSKSKFEIRLTKLHEEIDNGMEVATIRLKMPHGQYELAEEYYLYNIDVLIPDIGGYLGLILGCSLLSMYKMFTQWLFDCKKWLLNSKLIILKQEENPSIEPAAGATVCSFFGNRKVIFWELGRTRKSFSGKLESIF